LGQVVVSRFGWLPTLCDMPDFGRGTSAAQSGHVNGGCCMRTDPNDRAAHAVPLLSATRPLRNEWSLSPLRVRGLDRVRLVRHEARGGDNSEAAHAEGYAEGCRRLVVEYDPERRRDEASTKM
jgi:hypothetical protein